MIFYCRKCFKLVYDCGCPGSNQDKVRTNIKYLHESLLPAQIAYNLKMKDSNKKTLQIEWDGEK
jgi:hypothetical protein